MAYFVDPVTGETISSISVDDSSPDTNTSYWEVGIVIILLITVTILAFTLLPKIGILK